MQLFKAYNYNYFKVNQYHRLGFNKSILNIQLKNLINLNSNMKKENKSERVMVHVRMRPFSDEEMKQDSSSPIDSFDTVNNCISIKKDFDKKTYNYDTVLNMNIKQKDVFEKSAKIVVDVL